LEPAAGLPENSPVPPVSGTTAGMAAARAAAEAAPEEAEAAPPLYSAAELQPEGARVEQQRELPLEAAAPEFGSESHPEPGPADFPEDLGSGIPPEGEETGSC